MKITIETTDPKNNYQRKVIVEVPNDDLTTSAMFEDLIIPAVLGMGFSKENIDGLFENDTDIRKLA